MKSNIQTKRAYEPAEKDDGMRVLVDRLWPRGLKKDTAALDEWVRELAPSSVLRKWFNHDPERWTEFQRRYKAELRKDSGAANALLERAGKKRLTLIYAAHDEEHNHALVLAKYLKTLP